jgi:hypothetical protein
MEKPLFLAKEWMADGTKSAWAQHEDISLAGLNSEIPKLAFMHVVHYYEYAFIYLNLGATHAVRSINQDDRTKDPQPFRHESG